MTSTISPIADGVCEKAWEGLQPLIEHFHRNGPFNKLVGTIIVIDPRDIDRPKAEHQEAVFDSKILFKGFVGDFEIERYTKVARSKALLTWRHRLPSSVIQQQYPHVYGSGDTIWGGSTIDAAGLIVAFSGVQQVYDEAISEMMASMIRALCRDAMTDDNRGLLFSGISFIGDNLEPIQG